MAAGTRLTHFFLVVGDQYCLPGNDYLHSFLAGGLTYDTVCLGMSAYTPSWLEELTLPAWE